MKETKVINSESKMSFKKTGETKVYKTADRGLDKRTAEGEDSQYTVDDLVSDADKGISPYNDKNPSREDEKIESDK